MELGEDTEVREISETNITGSSLFKFDMRREEGYYVIDNYLDNPNDLKKLLLTDVHSLSDIRPLVLERIMTEYVRPYKTELLPQVQDGDVRLFRGDSGVRNLEKSPATGAWYSAFLNPAIKYAEGGKPGNTEGTVYYVDIPEQVAQQYHIYRDGKKVADRPSIHPEEFVFPSDILSKISENMKSIDWQIVHELKKQGTYSWSGVDLLDRYDELSPTQIQAAYIRDKILRLSFSELASYWHFIDNGENLSTTGNERIVINNESAENLLARICGWR